MSTAKKKEMADEGLSKEGGPHQGRLEVFLLWAHL